ncbi:MAG: mannitol-/sugar-/sorbitol-6-phosphatase [Frankiales bacterium]|nr:mannitol-/sugar-/sorbitol-6-phosphatase [Frankiales bacterium]
MPRRILSNTDPGWAAEVAGVLIDMDGTLVDSTASIERLWHAFLRWYGLPESAFPEPLHGRRAEDHVRGMLPEHLADDAVARLVAYEETDVEGVTAIRGAQELLESLDAAGMPWGIVTSGTVPVVKVRLQAAGLPWPPVLVTAEDVDRGKPDPQPYLVGRGRLGDHGTFLAVEDAPAGVTSALAAGCRVVAVSTTHRPAELTAAELILPDLSSLRCTA